MLQAIIRFSIRNKLIIGLLMFAWVTWGIIELFRLPIDALPDITSNQVQVITISPSLAAQEVERLISFPIEQASSNIPGIKQTRSISRFGLSVVTLVFEDKTDIYWARQQVTERLTLVKDEIPRDAGLPELAPVTTGLGEIYQYIVRPKKGYEGKFSLSDLRTIQDWIIRRQLLGTPGVADVSSFGGMLKQYEVSVSPGKLMSMGVTIADVFTALEGNNQNSGGAYIEKGSSLLFIRSEGLASTLEEIGKIFVKQTSSGIPVYIRDVSTVKLGHAVRYGAMTYKNEGEVTGAVVLMLKGENASRVIHRINKKMEQIKKTLPEGVMVETFLDRSKMVERAINTVSRNLLEGALIVVLVLVLFLGNLRAGLIVASVIPLSMLFAIGMMNFFDVSGNLMSLGALDFGLIVDGAVIIVEAVMFYVYHSGKFPAGKLLGQEEMNDVTAEAASRLMNAAVFGQIIILIVYLPILALTGIEGKMFRPMAQTVAFALVGAFILSLTYVPMITSLLMSKRIPSKENWSEKVMHFLQSTYERFLKRVLAFPKIILAIAIIFFAIALWVGSRLGGEFIPELQEGDFAVDAKILTGSSLAASIKTSQQAAGILQRFPEVEKIVTRIGSSEIPTDPMPIEMTDIMVSLKAKDLWTSAKSYDELANKMSEALREIPGLTAGFQYPVQMRFNELIAGARQDVVCKIFGEDLDSLAEYARQLGNLIPGIRGAKDLFIETVTGLPQIVVKYKREVMAMYQLNVVDVNRLIRTAFAGVSAGKIYENERRFDLVVRLSEQSRTSLEDVRQLLIPAPKGIQLPLYQVAEVAIEEGPNQIQREDASRRIIVGFNTRGRDVASIVNELQQKINAHIRFPPGYYIRFGGQFENLVEARQRLLIAVPVALLLIFIMLFFAFGSLRYGLLIFSAIPLSAIGGIFSLWIRDMPFSISAGVGFIALFGVAVLNGIVLISEFTRLRKTGITDIKQIIMEGSKIRLRPVLMTASVASLGFLPMALSQSAGAEVQRPLATVVIGGLVSATLLTLVVLPILYRWMEKRIKPKLNPVVIILFFICSFQLSTRGQQPAGKLLSLDSMLSMASRQNISLQAVQKNEEYWNALQEKTFMLSRTELGFEYGNINSTNNDTRFLVSQAFQMPSVYKRQKEFYRSNYDASRSYSRMKEYELYRQVRFHFYDLVDLLERRKLLQQLDSVYGRFLHAAEVRFRTGETNLLEKTTAEALVSQVHLQHDELLADLKVLQQNMQLLLNISEPVLPEYFQVKLTLDTVAATQHPMLIHQQQQIVASLAQTDMRKSELSPGLALGYSNQSIIGYQTSDGINQKYYSGSDRFHIFNITLGLSIFNSAAKARVRAEQLNSDMLRLQYDATDKQLKSQFLQYLEEYKKHSAAVSYYERMGLQQAQSIMDNARLSFENGNISYIEWTALMNQALTIRMNYLESVRMLNHTLIELAYITGK